MRIILQWIEVDFEAGGFAKIGSSAESVTNKLLLAADRLL
jgi:hypothetical protein